MSVAGNERSDRFYLVRTNGEINLPAGAVIRALPDAAVDTLDALAKGMTQIPASKPGVSADALEQIIGFARMAATYVDARRKHSRDQAAVFSELDRAFAKLPLLIRRPDDPIVGESLKGNR